MKNPTEVETKNLIREVKKSFFKDFYRQVKEIARPGLKKKGHKLIGIILTSMFIDYLAGFYNGVTVKNLYKNSGKRYKDFIRKYLPNYNYDEMWRDIRSRLVHNYSVGKNYAFTHMSLDGKHFAHVKHSNGKVYTIFNLEDFIKDVETAGKKYLKDLSVDKNLQIKAMKRRRSLGIMTYIPV